MQRGVLLNDTQLVMGGAVVSTLTWGSEDVGFSPSSAMQLLGELFPLSVPQFSYG